MFHTVSTVEAFSSCARACKKNKAAKTMASAAVFFKFTPFG
jgi:hypothetical protein